MCSNSKPTYVSYSLIVSYIYGKPTVVQSIASYYSVHVPHTFTMKDLDVYI